jgi:hypothetical protein
MIYKIFTVYDSKLEAYLQPFFMQSKGAAIRAFSDSSNDTQTQFSKHPGDFTLFEIGEYDDQNGNLKNYASKVNLGTALEHKGANQ